MTYKNDGFFYKSSLGQDLSHYIREKIEELLAAKSKNEIDARHKKSEEKFSDSEKSLEQQLAAKRAKRNERKSADMLARFRQR